MQKGFAHLILLIVIVLFAFGGYLLYTKGLLTQRLPITQQESSQIISQECGACGAQGLHNPDGAQCAEGLECRSGDNGGLSISGSICVKPNQTIKDCLKNYDRVSDQ